MSTTMASGETPVRLAGSRRRAALKERRESLEASLSRPASSHSSNSDKKGKRKHYEDLFEDADGNMWSREEVEEHKRRTEAGETPTMAEVRADLEKRELQAAEEAKTKAPTPQPIRARSASTGSSLSDAPSEHEATPSTPAVQSVPTIKLKLNLGAAKGKQKAVSTTSEEAEGSTPAKRQAGPTKAKKTIKSAGSRPARKSSGPRPYAKARKGRVLSDTESETAKEASPPPRPKVKAKSPVAQASSPAETGQASPIAFTKTPAARVKVADEAELPHKSKYSTPTASKASSPLATTPTTSGPRKAAKSKRSQLRVDDADKEDEEAPAKRAKTVEAESDEETRGKAAIKAKVPEKAKAQGTEQGNSGPEPGNKKAVADSITPKPRPQIEGTFKKTATPSSSTKKPVPRKKAPESLIGNLYQSMLNKPTHGSKTQLYANGKILPAIKKCLYRDTKMSDKQEKEYLDRQVAREEEIRHRQKSLYEQTFDLEEAGNLVRDFEKAQRCLSGQQPSVRFGEGGSLIESLVQSRAARLASM